MHTGDAGMIDDEGYVYIVVGPPGLEPGTERL